MKLRPMNFLRNNKRHIAQGLFALRRPRRLGLQQTGGLPARPIAVLLPTPHSGTFEKQRKAGLFARAVHNQLIG